jgi:hypothetical protein
MGTLLASAFNQILVRCSNEDEIDVTCSTREIINE